MKLVVRYFAGLRERFGTSEEAIDLNGVDDATVADLWAALEDVHPELDAMKSYVRVAVNRDFADDHAPVDPDDEIALIPPVSGGSGHGGDGRNRLADPTGAFCITPQPLDTDCVRSHVLRPDAGAVVVFEGVVRDHTGDHDVSKLIYETYLSMALDKLVDTGRRVQGRWADARIAIHHRYGELQIGQKAVVIAVSTPHRANAFDACQHAIDHLKKVVPIWKKEMGPDGDQWVGRGP